MKSDLEVYVASEFAATQQLLTRMLAHMAILAKHMGMEHDAYLSMILEASMRDLDLVDFWDVPEAQKETVREKAKARLAELITGASAR